MTCLKALLIDLILDFALVSACCWLFCSWQVKPLQSEAMSLENEVDQLKVLNSNLEARLKSLEEKVYGVVLEND